MGNIVKGDESTRTVCLDIQLDGEVLNHVIGMGKSGSIIAVGKHR